MSESIYISLYNYHKVFMFDNMSGVAILAMLLPVD